MNHESAMLFLARQDIDRLRQRAETAEAEVKATRAAMRSDQERDRENARLRLKLAEVRAQLLAMQKLLRQAVGVTRP